MISLHKLDNYISISQVSQQSLTYNVCINVSVTHINNKQKNSRAAKHCREAPPCASEICHVPES